MGDPHFHTPTNRIASCIKQQTTACIRRIIWSAYFSCTTRLIYFILLAIQGMQKNFTKQYYGRKISTNWLWKNQLRILIIKFKILIIIITVYKIVELTGLGRSDWHWIAICYLHKISYRQTIVYSRKLRNRQRNIVQSALWINRCRCLLNL